MERVHGRDSRKRRDAEEEGTPGTNIRPALEAARSELRVGELLAAPTFDLQTAMSAREIGDPKMDRGGPASGVDTRSLVERIADGEGRLDLRDSEVIAVMDRLLQMEVAWHDRYLLCQTVYTSLYVSSVARVKDALPELHAYCLSVDALSSFLYDAVYSNRVCCDEDVSVVLCGVRLSDFSPDDAINVLEDRLRGDTHSVPQHPVTQRLRWRSATLKSLVGMAKASCKEHLTGVVRSCDEAVALLDAMEFLDDADLERAEGFVPTLYYASLGHAPFRDVQLRPVREAAASWRECMLSLREAAHLLCMVHSWKSLKSFLDHISARDYHGFIRCLVYHVLVHQPGAAWAPNQAMLAREILLVDDTEQDTLLEHMETLPELAVCLEQGVCALQGICHVKCLNRARQHRRLRHTLRDWMNMMGHAYNFETAVGYSAWIGAQGFAREGKPGSRRKTSSPCKHAQIAPLTYWIVYEASWTCIEQLLMGGPLELYQPWEISMVFWYVSYLMGSADKAAKEHANISRSKLVAMVSGKSHALDQNDDDDGSLCGQVHGVLQMAVDSIAMASVALQGMGWSQSTTREFNDLKDSYEQRFGYMAELECPQYRPHDDYLAYEGNAEELSGGSPVKLLEQALHHTVSAHQFLVAVGEASSMREGLTLSEQAWGTVQGALAANMTALKLLVTIFSHKGDTEEQVSRYSVSWKFEDDTADVMGPSQSRMGGLALVARSLPKLVVVGPP